MVTLTLFPLLSVLPNIDKDLATKIVQGLLMKEGVKEEHALRIAKMVVRLFIHE